MEKIYEPTSMHMYVADSASANIEIWKRLNAWRRVKMSACSQLGNPYRDDVESVSQHQNLAYLSPTLTFP